MSDQRETIGVAVLGSGNIGTDLMYKLLRAPEGMQLRLLAGIDPRSEGLARARAEGIPTTHAGISAVVEDPEIRIVFDATSAKAHVRHAKILREAGRIAVDMTPAARGPYVVPPVNLEAHLNASNVNLITCGGQATIPLAFAVQRVTPLRYAEMVSTIASKSAGPGTRQNIDEFTATTATGLSEVGGAQRGKAIIILNPANPPINMTNTVYAVPEADEVDEGAIRASVRQMEAHVQRYVPGYRLRSDPVFEFRDTPWGRRLVVSIMIQVEGAGDFLPKYAGNLDIMTSSARRVGSLFAEQLRAHRGIQS